MKVAKDNMPFYMSGLGWNFWELAWGYHPPLKKIDNIPQIKCQNCVSRGLWKSCFIVIMSPMLILKFMRGLGWHFCGGGGGVPPPPPPKKKKKSWPPSNQTSKLGAQTVVAVVMLMILNFMSKLGWNFFGGGGLGYPPPLQKKRPPSNQTSNCVS